MLLRQMREDQGSANHSPKIVQMFDTVYYSCDLAGIQPPGDICLCRTRHMAVLAVCSCSVIILVFFRAAN